MSVQDKRLKDLIQNRKDLVEIHKKNDFTDGIHALLTDLYPDTAHFIYELLQNAEDMNATIARFTLEKDGIDFEHNGTKRNFTIDDIDAITNIGHNTQKKNDNTSIGKFGVGFKSVFAYTSTPIIHSGNYHFKIRDYFVPEFDVEPITTVDPEDVSWTKFSFPFNNPNKSRTNAYTECLSELYRLENRSILFLQNIRKIEFMLADGKYGYVERTEEGNNRIVISTFMDSKPEIEVSKWLRFSKSVNIKDDRGIEKTLPISVAFALSYDVQSKKYSIKRIQGQTFIYFPAEKEYSGLGFHINAPFASTVARDSVRNCKENIELIKDISQLLSDSLPEIKRQGMMNHQFFEALPNEKDKLPQFYSYVLDYVIAAFKKEEYIPAKNGSYISARQALSGPASISRVLKEEDVEAFSGINKTWILNAQQKNSRVDNFINSLEITPYADKDVMALFGSQNRANTEKVLQKKNIAWLRGFYLLCASIYDSAYNKTFVNEMQQTNMIRSSRDEMKSPNNIFMPPEEDEVLEIPPDAPIVDLELIENQSKTDKWPKQIKEFFQYGLCIEEYSLRVEIEKLLLKCKESEYVDDTYFADTLLLAKYGLNYKRHFDYSEAKIFLRNIKDGSYPVDSADNLFLGAKYGNEIGEIIANTQGKHCLSDEYAARYNAEDLNIFIKFARLCGIKERPEIIESNVYRHPLFREVLNSERRTTHWERKEDYTIPCLLQMLQRKSIEVNRAIWETLKIYGEEKNGYKYITASYSPNSEAPLKTYDSSLVYYLKQYEWVPDKKERFHKPGDIAVSELHKDFTFDVRNPIFVALNFNSDSERNKKIKTLEKEARKNGYGFIPIEDLDDYKEWKERKGHLLESRDISKKTSDQLLRQQNKMQSTEQSRTTLLTNAISVAEVAETFKNSEKMTAPQRRLFGRFVESTEEERSRLLSLYGGRCQLCGTRIIKANSEPYFVAQNLIDTRRVSKNVRATISLAWNSISMCPNCSAKYRVCKKDISSLAKQIKTTDVKEDSIKPVILTFELEDKLQNIYYAPRHFLALKKALELIDKEAESRRHPSQIR